LFRLRQSVWIAAFLDAVNVCAVALMVGVTVRLGIDALRGWPAWLISLGFARYLVAVENQSSVDCAGRRNCGMVLGDNSLTKSESLGGKS
jgi:hypothetical protein